jgi:hypothetical protein
VPDETSSSSSSLTGVWNGRYSYITLAGMPDNDFTAVIIDSGGFLSGTIYEAFRLPRGGIVDATATMNGHHRSNQVSFVKTYDGALGAYSIAYEGALSTDANEIQGNGASPQSEDRKSGGSS